MKTRAMLVAAMALIGSVSWAGEPGDPGFAVLNQPGSGIYKVIYQNKDARKVTLTISDANGGTIFRESIRVSAGFVRPVNFTGMIPGVYMIEVADEKGVVREKVNYGIKSQSTYAHVTRIKDQNKYLLTASSSASEKLNVRILDGFGNIVYEKDVNFSGTYGMVYNLEGVPGAPRFEITNDQGVVRTIQY